MLGVKEIFDNIKERNRPWRPRMYETEEELRNKIIEYFESGWTIVDTFAWWIKQSIQTYTITWLALYLGFESRVSLIDYSKKWEFSSTIKSAKTFIEQKYEEKLANWGGSGIIFALKNFQWKDIQTLEWEVNDNWERKFIIEHKRSKYENLDENWEEKNK